MSGAALTRRQYFALCSMALLSPALRLLPGAPAAAAGNASWLCGLAAYPALLLYALLIHALLRRRRAGEGMGALMLRALGPVAGRGALALYALWFLAYAAFLLRSAAERFVATVYTFSDTWPFVTVLLVISLIAALGGPKALFRAAEIFLPVLTGVLVLVLVFALPDLHVQRLGGVALSDAGAVLRGAAPIVNVGAALLLYPTFFAGLTGPPAPGRFRAVAKWLLRVSLLATLLSVVSTGMLGAELTARLSHPFFAMLRDITIFRSVERFEALILGLWVLPDFIFISLMLMLASGGLRTALGCPPRDGDAPRLLSLQNGRALIWLCALAALLGGLLLAPDSFTLERLSSRVVPAVTLAFTLGGTPVIYLVGRLRGTL